VIRVLLADDQALVRTGFRALLSAEDDIEVVAEAADGQQALS
jgi:DNA-binding NarL/FixJ family response regulator